MSLENHFKTLKSIQKSVVAAALGLGMMAGVAEAAPIAPAPLEAIQSPIEQAVVVVHHRRRPVVRHRRRQVCWWSHGRRICRWR
jgi:hypothetical protein